MFGTLKLEREVPRRGSSGGGLSGRLLVPAVSDHFAFELRHVEADLGLFHSFARQRVPVLVGSSVCPRRRRAPITHRHPTSAHA